MAKIKNNQIAKAIYESLKGKSGKELTEQSKKVVSFLAKKKLITKLRDILKEIHKYELKDLGILEAEVTTALPIQNKTKEAVKDLLKKRYKAKDVSFVVKLDESILGGMKVRVNDEVIDLSVLGRIKKLQEHLITKI